MKVTKFPQSCLIIERDGKRLLIDPGALLAPHYGANDIGRVDGVLITHEHSDHIDTRLLGAVLATNPGIPVYANASTKRLIGDMATVVVNDGDQFEVAGFSVLVRELPHVLLVDGTPGPQNSGYIIDGVFFDPGDGLNIADVRVPNLAVPIAGPDVSPRDVVSFIEQIGASTVIPMHYDYFPNNPVFMRQIVETYAKGVRVLVVDNGETVEL